MLKRLALVPILLIMGCGKGTETPVAGPAAVPEGQPNAAGSENPAAATSSTDQSATADRAQAGSTVADTTAPVGGVVDQLLQKAQQAVNAGQHAVAIEALSQAIGINAGDARLFRWRAEVYTAVGEYASARADLSMAIQVDPQNAELYNLRGYFLMTHGASGDAAADFDRSIEINPELAAAYNNRGLLKLAAGKYADAEADFTKAVQVDPKYPDAWNNRGFARLKNERPEEAAKDLRQAVKLKPDYATAWNNLGLVHLEQEDFQAAVKAFDQAVAQSPLDGRWLRHRRAALLKLDRFDEASRDAQTLRWLTRLDQLTDAARDRPGSPKAWLDRAAHLVQMKQYAAAAADYTRALQLSPADVAALNGRAFVWLQTGAFRQAVADCDESLVVQPSSEAFSLRGDAWLAMGNLDQAIEDFESARRFDPVVAEAYRRRATQREADGRSDEAAADRKMAEQISAGLSGKVATQDREPVPFPVTN